MKFSWKVFFLLFFAPVFYIVLIANQKLAMNLITLIFRPSLDYIEEQGKQDPQSYEDFFQLLKSSLLKTS